uniref:PX domain-containing protein n=1 Tax=Gongylonema pulchrum TaxID=637853 RepID=A0A183ET53_9BILA
LQDEEFVEGQTNSSNSFEVPLFDPERDISKWSVTIPLIEPRRDPVSGHTMYVYIISVERFDVKENNGQQRCGSTTQTKWTVARRYNEFYVLESKLLLFHGNTIKTQSLPPRRTSNTKSRAYVESQREHFERFIQQLAKQIALKRSDMLFAFLTSEQELKDSTQISDLYPWNVSQLEIQ